MQPNVDPPSYAHPEPPPYPTAPVNVKSDSPVNCICHNCHQSVITRIEKRNGLAAWGTAGAIAFLGAPCGCFLGCCLIPLCIDDFKVCDDRSPGIYINRSIFDLGKVALLSQLLYRSRTSRYVRLADCIALYSTDSCLKRKSFLTEGRCDHQMIRRMRFIRIRWPLRMIGQF